MFGFRSIHACGGGGFCHLLKVTAGQGSPAALGWWHAGLRGLMAGHLSGTRMAAVWFCFASHAQPWHVWNGRWCGCLWGELSWLGGGGVWDPGGGGVWDPRADDLEAKVLQGSLTLVRMP